MTEWIRDSGARVVVIFEGRDAAGKGGAIKRITEHLNPRIARIVALPVPTERQRTQWYFQRYVDALPAAGEIVLFDRSWYNRAGVEKVLGFCTPAEHQRFLGQPDLRTAARRRRDPAHEVLVQRERRGAGPAVRVAHRATPCGGGSCRRPTCRRGPVGRLLAGQGRDVRPHRHPRRAVVRGGGRRQAPRPAELHRAPADARAVRPPQAAPGRDARATDRPGLRPSPREAYTYVPDHAAELDAEGA